MSQQSNLTFFVKSTLTIASGTGATFNISNDNELDTEIEFSTDTSIVLKNDTQLERMIITATGGVATIVKRGLTQADSETEDANLKKQWNDGDSGYMSPLAFDLVDKGADNTFSLLQTFTDLDFTGDTTGGLKTKNLTTVQRDAITNASNGMIIYNTTTGVHNQYIGGAWSDFATGSVANASETVAGKVEIATDAEITAGTDTGGTGAKTSVLPGQLKKSVSLLNTATTIADTDNMVIDNAGENKKVIFTDIKATDQETIDRTSTSKFITPAGYKEGNKDQVQASTSRSYGVDYEATENGLLHGYSFTTSPSGTTEIVFAVYSDATATPTTLIHMSKSSVSLNLTEGPGFGGIPIKKGNYYRVEISGSTGTKALNFTPLN